MFYLTLSIISLIFFFIKYMHFQKRAQATKQQKLIKKTTRENVHKNAKIPA